MSISERIEGENIGPVIILGECTEQGKKQLYRSASGSITVLDSSSSALSSSGGATEIGS